MPVTIFFGAARVSCAASQTPALTTVPVAAELRARASRARNLRWRERLSSISGRQISAVSRKRISSAQIQLERLYRYDIARYGGAARQSDGRRRQIDACENSRR